VTSPTIPEFLAEFVTSGIQRPGVCHKWFSKTYFYPILKGALNPNFLNLTKNGEKFWF